MVNRGSSVQAQAQAQAQAQPQAHAQAQTQAQTQNVEISAKMNEIETSSKKAAVSSTLPCGINVKFDDICYKAPNGKTIMYKVSGEFRAGRMCAIMGPSGICAVCNACAV
jgi:ABC-type transport system involved in cytochrome bd biosynthesis fused ATPase/permease subunit